MTETAAPHPPPSSAPAKRRRSIVAVLSLGLLGSRAGHQAMTLASMERAKRGRSGEPFRPYEVSLGPHGTTVNPARFERWAFGGFICGVLDGLLTHTDGAPTHGAGSALTVAMATGIGGAVIALFLAGRLELGRKNEVNHSTRPSRFGLASRFLGLGSAIVGSFCQDRAHHVISW
jgi:hypothetical protein